MTLYEIFNTPGKLLQKGVATHFGVNPLFIMRAVLLATAVLTLTLNVNRPLRQFIVHYSGSF